MEESKCNGCVCYGCPDNASIPGNYTIAGKKLCHNCSGSYTESCYHAVCPVKEKHKA